MSSAISLVGKGIAFGAIHVMTGPDHLSALATLSSNLGNCKAFELGVRWGVGHSSGLLVVGIPLIILNDSDTVEMSEGLENAFETLVGVFMLLLGSYGMIHAFGTRTEEAEDDEGVAFSPVANSTGMPCSDHALGEANVETIDASIEPFPSSTNPTALVSNRSTTSTEEKSHWIQSMEECRTETSLQEISSMHDNDMPMSRWRRLWESVSSFCNSFSHTHSIYSEDKAVPRRCSYKVMAIGIGVVHGLAGPGGVLGLVPAINLHNWVLASIYLGSFCLSSTIIMGLYAASYGTVTSRLGWGREFHINCFSAALSILVGITWLVLLGVGKLHDVFP